MNAPLTPKKSPAASAAVLASIGLTAMVFAASSRAAAAETWAVFETAKDNGHALSDVSATAVAADASAAEIVCVPSQRYQRILGFGGALTESSAWVLAQLPDSRRAEVLRRYYAPGEGIGYTLARTHINSCDFSLGSWALDPVAGDTELEHFSLDPMRQWVLPLIHGAQSAAGPANFHLLASPWSPPSWMKTNGRMIFGGGLRPECRQAWADYFVRFIQDMDHQEHIPVWAITVQNEPQATQVWESCIFSAAEERDFVRDYLGPTLARAGMEGVHLCILDHIRDLVDEWTRTIYSDAKASRYVWGTALHWYVSDDFASTMRAHAAFPDKPTLFTEGCVDREVDSGKWVLGKWDHGERYAHSMINDFKNWVCGWIDWNIVLDQAGGPNHVGNFCDAPVIVDTETGAVRYQSMFYYIGQFSRFVRPGAERIESHGGPAGLESVAFANPDSGLAVVVLNKGESPVAFRLADGAESRMCAIPARAIQTYVRAP
jgi:glucosylceramidase